MTTESVAPKTQQPDTPETPTARTAEPSAGAPPTTPPATPAASQVATIVAGLRTTYATGRTRSIEWRKEQLRALARLMEENDAAITDALSQDLGRNQFEAYIADIATTVAEAKFAAKRVRRWTRRRYLLLEAPQLPGRGWVEYEPYGTVLIIGAWNYPFYLTLGPAVGAIAAGNAVVLKPSEIAPASSRLMAELVPRYLDNDAIAVIEGDGSVSQELIAQGLDRVMFTGGTEIGRKVYEGAAPHLTPVTLELGGKSPVIVADDADVDVAAKRIAWIKLLNAGQTCVAPDYVLADAKIRDELVGKISAAITKFGSGEPGGMRIVNQRQFDRLSGYISDAKAQAEAGGKNDVVVGGGCDASKLRIQPTVVVDPDPNGPLMSNEIFGPILPVLSVDSLDDAIRFVNSRPKPLSAYLFTKSRHVRERVIKEVPAGGMLVNHLAFQVSTAKLPFGGVGASGMGAYHGRWGFEEFSHRKSVLTKPTRPDLSSFTYPPYTERAFKLARKLF
ncbi:aldehyde dehydrogenase family protein [Mycobacterium spongiae]|uniref:Aldehyde dehydrogenase n=1 Tax=Mycobacterium spongiae TaxID=886343 RepID=A0A975JUI5_9MYCO|nr:aldehyde dehydrogenase family protein [Mycobacterium spongiae]QUR65901.1 aldehyde dehydrogenase family protein [Mycobacterium spongiae]